MAKEFICWLGPNNETPLFTGDACEFQLPNGKWLKGKIRIKRNGTYIFRAGKKEYPVFMRTSLRKVED